MDHQSLCFFFQENLVSAEMNCGTVRKVSRQDIKLVSFGKKKNQRIVCVCCIERLPFFFLNALYVKYICAG